MSSLLLYFNNTYNRCHFEQYTCFLFIIVNIGVRDRNRTCIIRICNPLPNRSATHAHILAESIRFELMRRFLNDSLANCWFNHSPNSPYRNSLTELHRIVTLSSLQVLALVDICKFTVIKCSYTKSFYMAEAVRFELTEHFCSSVFKTGAINRTLPRFHWQGILDSNQWWRLQRPLP